jgi:hypothetical protein
MQGDRVGAFDELGLPALYGIARLRPAKGRT